MTASSASIGEQVRACGLFFVSFVVLIVLPLVYHTFVFLLCVPLYSSNATAAVLLLIFFHFLLLMVIISYAQTIFTEPGFVPYTYDEAWISELNLATRFGLEAEVSEKMDDPRNPLTASAAEKKRDGRQRKCGKCKKIKPDRSHHCKYCGRCVLKMDHHCPWVNNCIGFRNYKFFMLFCGYTTTAAFYVVVTLFSGFIALLVEDKPIEFGTEEFEYCITFVMMGAVWIVLTGFTGFHLMLVCKNLSTIEHLEKRSNTNETKARENPFDLGRTENWKQVFGDNPVMWFLPFGEVKGNGVDWPTKTGMTNDAFGRGDFP